VCHDVKPTGLPTCLACRSLPKSAGQAPNYADISQFACGLRMESSACPGKVSTPKPERAAAGQLQRRGGVSHGTPCSPSFTHCVVGIILPGGTAGHFAEKVPCRRAQGWSCWVLPEAWLVSGGSVVHARFERRAPKNTRITCNNPSSCMPYGQSTARSHRKL
jgi:hypothetical protein